MCVITKFYVFEGQQFIHDFFDKAIKWKSLRKAPSLYALKNILPKVGRQREHTKRLTFYLLKGRNIIIF